MRDRGLLFIRLFSLPFSFVWIEICYMYSSINACYVKLLSWPLVSRHKKQRYCEMEYPVCSVLVFIRHYHLSSTSFINQVGNVKRLLLSSWCLWLTGQVPMSLQSPRRPQSWVLKNMDWSHLKVEETEFSVCHTRRVHYELSIIDISVIYIRKHHFHMILLYLSIFTNFIF